MAVEKELKQRIQRIEELVGKIDAIADPMARADAHELVQSLMDLHGAGIERMLETMADAGEPGLRIIDRLAENKLVASLLLLYGLHPLDLEARVAQALDTVRPYLRSQGGSVELLGLEEGVLRLRLSGGGQGCGSSADALKSAVEEAIYEAAPDLAGLRVERAEPQSLAGLVQLVRQPSISGREPHAGNSQGESAGFESGVH
jgi:Fe-S cluster biogenesis protein NfuA